MRNEKKKLFVKRGRMDKKARISFDDDDGDK